MKTLAELDFSTANLAALERVVDENLSGYYYVGRALYEIRERGLYRDAGHGTFEDYVLAKWGIGRAHAYRTIQAFRVAGLLSPIGDMGRPALPIPQTESHARELASLVNKPDKLREAWGLALELNEGKPTAEDVRAVVAGALPPKTSLRQIAEAVERALRILTQTREAIEATEDGTARDWTRLAEAVNGIAALAIKIGETAKARGMGK